jgi:hypothetical protein
MLPKKNVMLMIAFAIPVLCCLIGIGALILLTSSFDGIGDPNNPETPAKNLEDKLPGLRERLAKVDQKIEELEVLLKDEQQQLELALEIDKLIHLMKSSAEGLLGDLSSVNAQLAVVQTRLRELESSSSELGKERTI